MKTLHLLGRNNHIGGVELYIGTEDELASIATAGDKHSIFEVAPEKQADSDSPWPEGPGWYYSLRDADCVKVNTRFEAIAEILQHDGHPLSFTVEQAKEILRRADAGEDTGLWHHNRDKVITAIRRCLEDKNLLPPEPPESRTYKNWHGEEAVFTVGDRVLVHEDEGTLWEAKLLGFTSDGCLHLESDDAEGFELPWRCEVLTLRRHRITRGDYYGTTDNRADRWYIDGLDGPVDRPGKGYRTAYLAQDALAALEAGLDWRALPQD